MFFISFIKFILLFIFPISVYASGSGLNTNIGLLTTDRGKVFLNGKEILSNCGDYEPEFLEPIKGNGDELSIVTVRCSAGVSEWVRLLFLSKKNGVLFSEDYTTLKNIKIIGKETASVDIDHEKGYSRSLIYKNGKLTIVKGEKSDISYDCSELYDAEYDYYKKLGKSSFGIGCDNFSFDMATFRRYRSTLEHEDFSQENFSKKMCLVSKGQGVTYSNHLNDVCKIKIKDYISFSLSNQSYEHVIRQLNLFDADFDASFGYRGSSMLPSIKVKRYSNFEKFGNMKEAWLRFAPNSMLYEIYVTYEDSDKVFSLLKDGLDVKYNILNSQVFGFNSKFLYRDGSTDISLLRDSFNKNITLIYTWTPFTDDVNNMERVVDDQIKMKNANKAKDL